jgi:protein O-mannosyl-transferase
VEPSPVQTDVNKRTLITAIFLSFLTLVTYVNIFPNRLLYDDEELIYKNAYVQNFRYLPKYFTTNMIAGAGKISNMYRPVLTTSFAIDYHIWGTNPLGYHLTSIILHATNAILILMLMQSLFGNFPVSLITAVLFIIHPVASEAVAYASGRTDLLYSFFALISLRLYSANLKKPRRFLYPLSIIFFLAALLSKETAFVLPALLLILGIWFKKIKFIPLIFSLLPFFFLDAIYFVLRLTVLNFMDTLNFYGNNNIYSGNLTVRLMTFSRVFFDYLGVLIFPRDLAIMRNFQIIQNPVNFWVWAFILLCVFLSAIAIMEFRNNNRLPFFIISWFAILILPVIGIIPINNIDAEHYLYLPAVSFYLVIAFLLSFFWKKFSARNARIILIGIGLFIGSGLIARTIIREFDWRDPITFYNISIKQSPNNIPMRNNLAMAYAENNETDKAIEEYKNIISQSDIYPNVHHNLANAYKTQGKFALAEEEYKKAIKLDPDFYFSVLALADLYKQTGQTDKLNEIQKIINQHKLK